MIAIEPGQTYKHFKGGRYKIVGIAKHSETLEELVIYEPLYDNPTAKIWARPLNDFIGSKEVDGKIVKRFELE